MFQGSVSARRQAIPPGFASSSAAPTAAGAPGEIPVASSQELARAVLGHHLPPVFMTTAAAATARRARCRWRGGRSCAASAVYSPWKTAGLAWIVRQPGRVKGLPALEATST